MKIDDATETLTRFFNDLIGSLVPGAVLAVGLSVMHLGPRRIVEVLKPVENTAVALAILGLMFAAGHVLLALFEHTLQPILQYCCLTNRFDEEKSKQRRSYCLFLEIIEKLQTAENGPAAAKVPWTYNELRNVALSVTAEGASLGRRFMFISLLCNGVGTALVIMLVDFGACLFLAPNLLFPYADVMHWALQGALMLGCALVLFKRGEVFHGRAMATPFSIAIAELKLKLDGHGSK